jgi:hypothetical protein
MDKLIDRIFANKPLQSILIIGGCLSLLFTVIHYISLIFQVVIQAVKADWEQLGIFHYIAFIYGCLTLIYFILDYFEKK